MRNILHVSLFIVFSSWMNASFSQITHKPTIGFGATNSFFSDLSVEDFVAGFTFAISPNATLKEEVVIETKMDRSPLAASILAKKLLDSGAKALIGFPGSHDCLLAAKEAAKKSASSLFLNCSHNDLKQYSGRMATTVSDMNEEVQSMLEFLTVHEKRKNGLVIIHPQHIASRLQGDLYLKLQNNFKGQISYNVVDLSSIGTIPEGFLNKLKSREYDFIVLTAYPDLLQPLREQFTKESIVTNLYGSSAWDNLEVARRFLLNLNNKFVYPTPWDRSSRRSQEFIKSFKNKFAKEPSPEAAFGYDLGLILVQISKSNKSHTLSEGLKTAISERKCFTGLLTNSICLGDLGAHSHKERTFVQVTQKGLIRVYPR